MKNQTGYFVYFDAVDDWQIVHETEIPLDKLKEAFKTQKWFEDYETAADYVIFQLNFYSRVIAKHKKELQKSINGIHNPNN
jgi:CRISPR/Cas system-associated protein endoribonuclease Cas2